MKRKNDTILLFDVGSTYTKYMLGGKPLCRLKNQELSSFLLKESIKNEWKGKKGFIASVTPSINPFLRRELKRITGLEAYFIHSKDIQDLTIDVEQSEKVGIDRLVNAVAGHKEYRKNLILVDMGTATTVDVVTKDGSFLGGMILPGFETFRDMLFTQTEQLKEEKEKLHRVSSFPESLLGKNTGDALFAGIFGGYTYMIKGLLDNLKKELQGHFFTLATGGALSRLNVASLVDAVDEQLSLKGISHVAETIMRKENNE